LEENEENDDKHMIIR